MAIFPIFDRPSEDPEASQGANKVPRPEQRRPPRLCLGSRPREPISHPSRGHGQFGRPGRRGLGRHLPGARKQRPAMAAHGPANRPCSGWTGLATCRLRRVSLLLATNPETGGSHLMLASLAGGAAAPPPKSVRVQSNPAPPAGDGRTLPASNAPMSSSVWTSVPRSAQSAVSASVPSVTSVVSSTCIQVPA